MGRVFFYRHNVKKSSNDGKGSEQNGKARQGNIEQNKTGIVGKGREWNKREWNEWNITKQKERERERNRRECKAREKYLI